MAQIDQALRKHIDYQSLSDGKTKEANLPAIFRQMAIVDRNHQARLQKLVAECGWPRRSTYGQRAAGDAWLLAQHAEPKFQKRLLPLLKAAVEAGDADGTNLAYLADRVANHEGAPQLYGTQFDMKGQCVFELQKMDDRSKVNERRKMAGMPSLEEYESQFIRYFASQGCPSN